MKFSNRGIRELRAHTGATESIKREQLQGASTTPRVGGTKEEREEAGFLRT